MREIKFRVWDKQTKRMHICGEDGHDEIDFEYKTNRAYYYNLQNGCGSLREDSDYVLMQYTGMYDKNGKEIYEGDIILTQPFRDKPYSKKYKEKRLKGIVEYNVKCGDNFYGCEGKMKYWGAEWRVEIIDKEDFEKFGNYNWGRFFECEVIGNIYNNKELLNETKS